MLLISTMGMSQDTLSVHELSPSVFVHLDSTQSFARFNGKIVLYVGFEFYITTTHDCTDVHSSGAILFKEDGYYVVKTRGIGIVKLTCGGKTFALEIKPKK